MGPFISQNHQRVFRGKVKCNIINEALRVKYIHCCIGNLYYIESDIRAKCRVNAAVRKVKYKQSIIIKKGENGNIGSGEI